MDEWVGRMRGWVDEWFDQWVDEWKKELMNEQNTGASSAHFSLNIRKSKFASCGERSPLVRQRVSGTLSPHSPWVPGTQAGGLRLGQWEKAQLLPQGSVRQPPWGQGQGRSSCLLVSMAASPTTLLHSLLPCSHTVWATGSPVVTSLPGLPGTLSDHCHLCPGLLGGQWGLPCRQPPLLTQKRNLTDTLHHLSGQLMRKVLNQVVSEPQRAGRTKAQSSCSQGSPHCPPTKPLKPGPGHAWTLRTLTSSLISSSICPKRQLLFGVFFFN